MSGKLPIRILMNDAIEASIKISPSFGELLKDEINANNLKPDINYHHINNRDPINEIAQIDTNRRIHLYENFCQFLWCITYSMIVQFDWFNSKPDLLSIKVNHFDRAVKLFDEAFQLLQSNYVVEVFFELPNPEAYEPDEQGYIEAVNNVFNYSVTFILLHEFSHSFYGHLDTENSSFTERKDEERAADKFATDTMLKDGSQKHKYLYELGITFALIALVLLNSDLKGGDFHPDIDERIKDALSQMESDEVWGYASMALVLWNLKHSLNISILPVEGSHKDLFYSIIQKINYSADYKY